ncbi:MAG TPA: dihydropteroate synthase [Baekduia sp.]|uniref:dihydropteroate synthase n=1 Tax=Baekduia sp. TaxID=2600305 RepID=UPI002D76A388|nr:dihydropteroate synthase [Baekduia sp.]HET6509041.1 dihydropteroate synthase [Baekduia sp.]
MIEPSTTRPAVMGIVNVTPDSFSGDGLFGDGARAERRARAMVAQGAAVVDVGGESTRPGAEPVGVDDELRRVVPLLERIGDLPVSIDTRHAEVARTAIALGATMVNDVTAMEGDPAMAAVVAGADVDVCLVHMQGDPRTMQRAPRYDDVVDEVAAYLERRMLAAAAAGIREERIWLDPGIGFGKTPQQNFRLLGRLEVIAGIGRPLLLGVSRKRSLAWAEGRDGTVGSVAAGVAAAVAAFHRGATMLRAHDVPEHVAALAVAREVETAARTWVTAGPGASVEGVRAR